MVTDIYQIYDQSLSETLKHLNYPFRIFLFFTEKVIAASDLTLFVCALQHRNHMLETKNEEVC